MIHQPLAPSVKIVATARSHEGNVRAQNEDSYLARRPFYLVADGMGGHAWGDVASQAAVTAFNSGVGELWATREQVCESIREAQAVIKGLAEGFPRAPGTTITGAVLVLEQGIPSWYVVNIGDSRTYLWRDGKLRQITRDHSARRARHSNKVQRNVITRALGAGLRSHVAPDEWLIPIKTGDLILVCSDGLYTQASTEQIEQILAQMSEGDGGGVDVCATADELMRVALAGQAPDNVTVVVAYAADVTVSGNLIDDDDTTVEDPFADDDTRDDSAIHQLPLLTTDAKGESNV